MNRWLLFFSILTSAWLFCGCSEGDERNHPLFRQGENARYNGNGEEAVKYFKTLLKRRPESVYTHLQLANIYDEMLNDPFSAVMHYRLYLEGAPDSADTEEVKVWMLRAEKRCYASLKERFDSAKDENKNTAETLSPPAATEVTAAEPTAAAAVPASEPSVPVQPEPTPDQRDQEIAELQKKLHQYALRHRLMMDELVRLRQNQSAEVENSSENPVANVQDGENMTYTVARGDTPGSIARKVYGKSSLAQHIMQANPGLDARKLRPGMKLIIPPKP